VGYLTIHLKTTFGEVFVTSQLVILASSSQQADSCGSMRQGVTPAHKLFQAASCEEHFYTHNRRITRHLPLDAKSKGNIH
jgi:hypothetical protein